MPFCGLLISVLLSSSVQADRALHGSAIEPTAFADVSAGPSSELPDRFRSWAPVSRGAADCAAELRGAGFAVASVGEVENLGTPTDHPRRPVIKVTGLARSRHGERMIMAVQENCGSLCGGMLWFEVRRVGDSWTLLNRGYFGPLV